MANRTIRTDRARDTFLRVLSDSCNVSAACRAAEIGRQSAYDWRNDDPDFAAAWKDAEDAAVDDLEQHAWNRARVDKSDRMLEILLKAHRSDKYVEKLKTEHSGGMLVEVRRTIQRPGDTDRRSI